MKGLILISTVAFSLASFAASASASPLRIRLFTHSPETGGG